MSTQPASKKARIDELSSFSGSEGSVLDLESEISSSQAVELDPNGRVICEVDIEKLDFSFSVFDSGSDSFLSCKDESDCDLVFSSGGSSFWLGTEDTPANGFERLARKVLLKHTSGLSDTSAVYGAEWWVQRRLASEISEKPISFHWDKDEDLVDMCGIGNVHPYISTVTYLTSFGGPTLVLEKRTGETAADVTLDPIEKGYLCFPRAGRHLNFDGRYLHGVVGDLAKSNDGLRLTFLVNIWVGYRPQDIERFPTEANKSLQGFTFDLDFGSITKTKLSSLSLTKSKTDRMDMTFNFGQTGSEHTLHVPNLKCVSECEAADALELVCECAWVETHPSAFELADCGSELAVEDDVETGSDDSDE